MSNLGSNFYPKLVEIASELGMKPEDILAIMISESGLDPTAHEQKYNGGGLIGFMPDTLKNLGYKGSPDDFRKLDGTNQLDYVKKNIANNIRFNGSPFKSAAQYYVANFFPVALKLPGIQNEDNHTAFIEENPETAYDPRTGKKYSKKYLDIGYKIDPSFERAAYKANPLFHGNTPGAITYGDMVKQVEKNKQNPLYRQALNNMKNVGYVAKEEPSHSNIPNEEHSSSVWSFLAKMEKLLGNFITASEKHTYLISLASSADNAIKFQYANILKTALKEYLSADVKIHQDNDEIELECLISGDKKKTFAAIKEFSNNLTEVFYETSQNLQKDRIFITLSADIKSKHPEINIKTADRYGRKLELLRKIQ